VQALAVVRPGGDNAENIVLRARLTKGVQRRVLKLQVLDSPNPTAAFTTVRTAAHHIDIPESDVDILFDTDAPNLFMTA
jgi:hypothetical protein